MRHLPAAFVSVLSTVVPRDSWAGERLLNLGGMGRRWS